MPNPPGRPFIEVDWKKLDNLLIGQCTCEEAAGELGISTDTLTKRIQEKDGGIYSGFTAYAQSKKKAGLAKLRLTQFQKALQGNSTMLCKLGDVYLGQSKETDDTPPNDALLSTINQLINDLKEAKNENLTLTQQLNALKSQANSVVQRSEQEVQHMGGVDESRQDLCVDTEVRPSS